MKISVQSIHFSADRKLLEFIQKKADKLDQFFDHIIRNDTDLQENLDYIAMNPVRAGYVTRPQFYPYSGFLS